MGNQNQKQANLPKSPSITLLRSSIRLEINHKRRTKSLINNSFGVQMCKSDNNQISRILSPFCVLEISAGRKSGGDKQWIDCCLISPIMGIASPRAIVNQTIEQSKQGILQGLTKSDIIEAAIQQIFIIEKNNIAVLIFKQPIWQLGWAGLTYLQSNDQIKQIPLRSINHPTRKTLDNDQVVYKQMINKVVSKDKGQFRGGHKDHPGSIIFTIIDKRPYILGIQINQYQIRFFNQQIIQNIQGCVQTYLNVERQKQILKSIDIPKFQMQTRW